MSKPKRRQGSAFYYAQRAVPKDLKTVLGNGPLWKTLETKDLEEAKPRCRRQHDAWDDLFQAERAKLKAASEPTVQTRNSLTPDQLKARQRAQEEWERENQEYWDANPLRAAPGHVQARAEQLIALALSLLRLSLEEYAPLFPHVGEVETSSFSPDKLEDTSVILKDGSASFEGTSLSGYWVDHRITALTHSSAFKQRADHLFAPKKETLAVRVAQGLIWQTRGRRSIDRTERLLFFFTAIEALLSHSSGAPVAETIARFASVLLREGPSDRENTYRRVKALYDARSKVAHTGSHSVSDGQANSVQYLAEALYRRVLSIAPLDQPHAAFTESLSAATHGGTWPPEKPSEVAD